MKTRITVTMCAIMIAVQLSLVIANPCPEDVITEEPMNQVVNIGQNVSFTCRHRPVNDMVFPTSWQYLLLGYSRASTFNKGSTEAVNLGLSTENNVTFIITNVTLRHAGNYTCLLQNRRICEGTITSTAVLIVIGPAEISLPNDTTTFNVNTTSNLVITAFIAGYPEPKYCVYREVSGQLVQVNNSRFNVTRMEATLSIVVRNVKREDKGYYRVEARNENGGDSVTISIVPVGPDPPVVTFSEDVIVSPLNERVEARCEFQEEASAGGMLDMSWMHSTNGPISSDPGEAVYTELSDNCIKLIISSFEARHSGEYICTGTNSRGSNTNSTVIFGPPPSPSRPTINTTNSVIILKWRPPNNPNNIPITSYIIKVYRTSNDEVVDEIDVAADPSRSNYNQPLNTLDAGNYYVTVTSTYSAVSGGESRPSVSFPVEDHSTTTTESTTSAEEESFPVIIVGAGVGAFVMIALLAIGIFVGIYCICYYNRKKQMNSHGHGEDKDQSIQAVPNTYTTALALDNSELPPSPLSPMTSSITLDPKWEFSRENIQLLDVLAEGQFTVLYRAIAKGLREKPCEVAVKSLREDATEDDVKALNYEMDLLASIEEHPNIVSLIRVCSVGRPLFMVMEYMCHGDLLGFLRACRGHHGMYTVSPGTRYQPPSLQLCSRDILNMATKIAHGMRYLADRKIVHRALCTKNILVGSGMDVKIYNVGSFDAVLDTEGLVKWLAPETMFDRTYTTYSDVWSFGVTLWELVTVGGTPYSDIQLDNLYAQLQNGMRMLRPTHCAQEVYDIMSACWQKNPTDRPHFAIIHENLDNLVMSKLSYLDLKSYDGYAYSQFGDDVQQFSTAL